MLCSINTFALYHFGKQQSTMVTNTKIEFYNGEAFGVPDQSFHSIFPMDSSSNPTPPTVESASMNISDETLEYAIVNGLKVEILAEDMEHIEEASVENIEEAVGKGIELRVMAELSIDSIMGLAESHTMRLKGLISETFWPALRKFVIDYGDIACPLNYIFGWTDEAKKAFKLLNWAISLLPMLALPSFFSTICGGDRCFKTWSNPTTHVGFTLHNGKLFRKGRQVLTHNCPYIPTLLQEYQSGVIGGHSGVLKTFHILATNCIASPILSLSGVAALVKEKEFARPQLAVYLHCKYSSNRKDYPTLKLPGRILKLCLTNFHPFTLKDKMKSWAGSIDKPPIPFTHAKRDTKRQDLALRISANKPYLALPSITASDPIPSAILSSRKPMNSGFFFSNLLQLHDKL
ncbi:hypothetical protein FEM48_Zijuj01G0166200 [Ziziphus jujuba var. spinosa]|uniref:Uncharacterized protein n=1 Tax=Ziziphus jujuba var. spinosa TaxID=714518 RepID=A0A978W2D0_ZIZJJ|nr:hypothetical protein FEM48_Zijuj01G0166200 [Ziziphus jujuba var. spinosa]